MHDPTNSAWLEADHVWAITRRSAHATHASLLFAATSPSASLGNETWFDITKLWDRREKQRHHIVHILFKNMWKDEKRAAQHRTYNSLLRPPVGSVGCSRFPQTISLSSSDEHKFVDRTQPPNITIICITL